MSHPLEQSIATLRARVRRLVTLYGLSWVVGVMLAVVLVLGLADYLIRFQDRGIRVICSLLVLGALGWSCYRYLYRPLFARLSDVDLASRLQRRFPVLQDRLVSSVEFLKQSADDPTAGSAALRQAVIAQSTAETERLDFCDVLDRRPPARAAMVTLSICLVAAILLVLDYRAHHSGLLASQIAVARLANPFGTTAWNKLKLVEQVSWVAKGEKFTVEVYDQWGLKLPSEVSIHYRFEAPDGTVTEKEEPMRPFDGRMVAVRENVVQPFSYRVEGAEADDNRPLGWISVEVVQPPEIESLAIRLIPPEYTGWPEERLQREAAKQIRAWVDTRIIIQEAASTKQLQSAALCLEVDGRIQEIPGRISGGGYSVDVPELTVKSPQHSETYSYWFKLIDRRDAKIVGGGDFRGEIRAITDAPPTVVVQRPTERLFVIPRAVVPVQVAVEDDLAVRDVSLVFSRSGGPKQEERLSIGPERVESQPAGGRPGSPELRDRHLVEHAWDLAGLKLSPGTQLTFRATATDSKSQTGESEPRYLIVITAEELRDHIARRQSLILDELARALEMQRESRSQVNKCARLAETGQLGEDHIDDLKTAELSQREVKRILTSRSEGVPKQILALLADLEHNQVDSPDVRRHMQAVLSEINRLDGEHLAVIGRELTAAIKAAGVQLQKQPVPPGRNEQAKPPPPDPQLAGSLARAVEHQGKVIESLRSLLGQLGRWDNYRRFHREIGRLLRDQKQVQRRTTEVGRRTLTKELKDLPPQDQKDLESLAKRQLELARRLDGIQREMEQAGRELQESDPLAAQNVADALAQARRLAIGTQMRDCGRHLKQNQIGQAGSGQKQIARDLQQVLDVLANRRRDELARLVKKLTQAEAELAKIERQQAGLRKQLEEGLLHPDQLQRREQLQRLSREQHELQQITGQMAWRLERLLADRAGRTTAGAAERMGQAGRCAAQGNAPEACQQAQQAHKALREAREQLAARRLQAQAELAMEQLAQLQDALKDFRGRQQNLLDETRQFAKLQPTGRARILDLAQRQRALQTETGQLSDQLVGAPALNLALSGAAHYMGRAAALLYGRQTGPKTQRAEQDALRRLDLLLDALKSEPLEDEPDGASGAGSANGGTGGQGGATGGVLTATELKLLKLLQQEINDRTRQLQQEVGAAETLTEQQLREYVSLSEEQGRLADLALQLLQVEQPDPEEYPEALPDMRLDGQEEPRPLPPEEELP